MDIRALALSPWRLGETQVDEAGIQRVPLACLCIQVSMLERAEAVDWKTIGNYVLLVGLFVAMLTMFNQVNRRLDTMNGRIDTMQADMNRRFDTMQAENNRRFDEMNRRFDTMQAENQRQHDEIKEVLRVFEGRITRLEEKAAMGPEGLKNAE